MCKHEGHHKSCIPHVASSSLKVVRQTRVGRKTWAERQSFSPRLSETASIAARKALQSVSCDMSVECGMSNWSSPLLFTHDQHTNHLIWSHTLQRSFDPKSNPTLVPYARRLPSLMTTVSESSDRNALTSFAFSHGFNSGSLFFLFQLQLILRRHNKIPAWWMKRTKRELDGPQPHS